MLPSALLVGRILFGGFFLYSGVNHLARTDALAAYAASQGVPSPELAVVASGALLVLGGLSVILGFVPRVGLALIILFLVPVSLAMHAFWKLPDAQARASQMTQFLKNTALAAAALGWMAVAVPWPYSVDEVLRRRSPRFSRWARLDRPAHQT